MGTAFPHLLHVLLLIELEAVSKWLFFGMRSQIFFVSTTSLVQRLDILKFVKNSTDLQYFIFQFGAWSFVWGG